MSNFKIDAPLVNGSSFPLHESGDSCASLVVTLLGDDLRPPPRSVIIEVITASGKTVNITIPNDTNSVVNVKIDDVVL